MIALPALHPCSRCLLQLHREILDQHHNEYQQGSRAELDLNALRMFVAVADAAALAAARKLNLPKWSVSRRLSQLEATMGVPLLHRTTRRVVLSPAGAALHERVASLIASLEQAAVESPDHLGEPAKCGSPRRIISAPPSSPMPSRNSRRAIHGSTATCT